MKEIIRNESNLKEKDVTEVVKRVKLLITNSNNEILLGYSHSDYQFPGGHVEKGENLVQTIKREIKEETGIVLNHLNINPFAKMISYYKDWPEKGKNRKRNPAFQFCRQPPADRASGARRKVWRADYLQPGR